MSAMPPYSSTQQPAPSSATLSRQASYSRRMRLSQSSQGNAVGGANGVSLSAPASPATDPSAMTGMNTSSIGESPFRRAQAAASSYSARSTVETRREEENGRSTPPSNPRNKVAARVQMFESHNNSVQFEKSPRHPQSRNDSPRTEVTYPSTAVSLSPKRSRTSAFTAVQSYQPNLPRKESEVVCEIDTPHKTSSKVQRRNLRNGTTPSPNQNTSLDHTPSTSNVTKPYLSVTTTNDTNHLSRPSQAAAPHHRRTTSDQSLNSSFQSNASNASFESIDLTERRRKMALARRYNNSNKTQAETTTSTTSTPPPSLDIDPLDKEAITNAPDMDPLDKESKASSSCILSPSRRRKMDRAAAAKRHRRQVQEQRLMEKGSKDPEEDILSLLKHNSEESGGTAFSTSTGMTTAMTGISMGLSKGDYMTSTSRTDTTAMSSIGTWETQSGIGGGFERGEFDMDLLGNAGIVSNSPFHRHEKKKNDPKVQQVSKFDPFAALSTEEIDANLEFRKSSNTFTEMNVPASPRLEPSMFDSAPGSSPRRLLMRKESPSSKSPSRRRERRKGSPSRQAMQLNVSSHAGEGMYKLPAVMSYNDDDDDTQFNSVSMPYPHSGPPTPSVTAAKQFSPKSPETLSNSSLFSGNAFDGSGKMNAANNSHTQNSVHNGDDESLTGSVNGSWTGRMRARQKVEAQRNPLLAPQEEAPRPGLQPSSPSNRSIHKPLVPGEVIPSLPNYDYADDMREGVEEVTKYAKEDPPAVAVSLGALGVLCGTMVLGPIGLILGAAGVGIGYGVMQMPDDQRTKVKGKAKRAAERLQESAIAANEVVSSSCAAACGQSSSGETGTAMDAESVVNHHQMQSYPPHSTAMGAERYDARGFPSPPHTHTKGVHGIGMNQIHPSSPGGHARSPEVIVASNLPPSNSRPNMGNRRLVAACRRMGRITPVNQIHSLDPSLHPRAWLDVMASAWTSREEKNEAMEEILILAKDKGHSRMLLEVRGTKVFPIYSISTGAHHSFNAKKC